MIKMTIQQEQFIQNACAYLEFPSHLIELTNLVGKPLELGMKALPANAKQTISKATRAALNGALQAAVFTLKTEIRNDSFEVAENNSFWTRIGHDVATAATGAAGGFLGLAALPIELPITTAIMLRGIASIGSDFGEDLSTPQTQLECLNVFALGAPGTGDDGVTPAYFVAREAMAQAVKEAALFLSKVSAAELSEAIARGSAPTVIRFISQIAARFEVVVTEKALAQAVPIIGSVAGGLINVAFTEHFNAIAKFHFGLRRLERDLGTAPVEQIYGEHLLKLKRQK